MVADMVAEIRGCSSVIVVTVRDYSGNGLQRLPIKLCH